MKKYRVHILLFIATLIATTLSGAEWIFGSSFLSGGLHFRHFIEGLWFSVPFLTFLTFHEFGHYFMAKARKVKVTLPYYLPAWFGIFLSIGTFGAFIKIKDFISSKKDYFDIGIAGPLAGFVVALFTLIIGFIFMPGDEYIYHIHPEYQKLTGTYREFLDSPENNMEAIVLGKSLLYSFVENTFGNPNNLPHPYELSHYPLILAGFLGLLFTAINLLPIGQLDGGHILYALVGRKAFNIISPAALVLLIGFSGLGFFSVGDFSLAHREDQLLLLLQFIFYVYFIYLCFSKIYKRPVSNWILALSVVLIQLLISKIWPNISGYPGFLVFGFLLGKILGVYHPETLDHKPLDRTRVILGWLAMLIFILCFIPYPIS